MHLGGGSSRSLGGESLARQAQHAFPNKLTNLNAALPPSWDWRAEMAGRAH